MFKNQKNKFSDEKSSASLGSYEHFIPLTSSGSDLLEIVLADAKPVVRSTVNAEYDIKARPTELSSGGYIDSPGT